VSSRQPGSARRTGPATTATDEKIRAANAGEANKPAKPTTIPYREALERLWILDPLPAWLPTSNHISRLTTGPKHHLADPALAARLTGADASALIVGDEDVRTGVAAGRIGGDPARAIVVTTTGRDAFRGPTVSRSCPSRCSVPDPGR
jgi:hypothetical protein